MIRIPRQRPPITIWAVMLGLWAGSSPVVAQEEPGDQLFRFGVSEKIGATDNIRLNSPSVGTTYYSDTTFSFGFSNEAGPHALDFSTSGVARIVNDPLIGTDSGFRDPRADLAYVHDNANSRLALLANYARLDLAFLDPLQQGEITDQDLYTGGGTREEYFAGLTFETGLQSPLGFVFDVNSLVRNYNDTTDPLLFSNQTDAAVVGMIFRFSPVTRGRLDYSQSWYRAKDTPGTNSDTRRFTFGLDHDFSAISTLSVDLGHSKVFETFDSLPGVENNTSGPVGILEYRRLMPNGEVNARLDSILTVDGRQTTIEFGRVFEFPTGGLEVSLGAAQGQSFSARPIGSIAYVAELPRSEFNVELSRTASISDTLSQATETTQLDLGYAVELNPRSALSFNLYYADITLVGNTASGAGRERGSFYATYNHNVTEDWALVLGYEYKYYAPDTGSAANSNGVFITLQRDFNVFR